MKLYAAGNAVTTGSEEQMYETGLRNRLLTFANIDDWAKRSFAYWVGAQPPGVSIFLDSGAFGAYTRKAVIDLDRYCEYIAANQSKFACYAALDVIGDWKASHVNLERMVKKGLQPIPCFHRGSPFKELDRLAAEFPYIALGGLVGDRAPLTKTHLQPYLDECFEVLEKRWPVKVHVFGVMVQWVLERYPLYSADSASTIMGAGIGRVQHFKIEQHGVNSKSDAVMRSDNWRALAKRDLDGSILDGVGRTEGNGSAHNGRKVVNVRSQVAYERYLTDVWRNRGVAWEAQ